jgi:hypothetical protein
MQIAFEDLPYQVRAVAAAVGVLSGQARNTFDNSNLFGIQANVCDLSPTHIDANKRRILTENGVSEEESKLSPDCDI